MEAINFNGQFNRPPCHCILKTKHSLPDIPLLRQLLPANVGAGRDEGYNHHHRAQ